MCLFCEGCWVDCWIGIMGDVWRDGSSCEFCCVGSVVKGFNFLLLVRREGEDDKWIDWEVGGC